MQPLGICIPTYKRPDQLRRCVESVVGSAGSHSIPIHIADDSGDETNDAVVAELRRRYPRIVHHRNPANLGLDRNILHAVDVCDCRHAWLLGEDDRLTPQAVTRVLEVVSSGERPFVYVNYASVDEDLRLVLRERSLDLAADLEEPADRFLAEHAWSAGFLGACIVARGPWGAVRAERYVGTYYAHLGVILELLRGRQAYLVSEPLVLNRAGTPAAFTWKDSTFDVLHGWARMVDLLRPFYPAESCDRAVATFASAHRLGSPIFFAYLRADGALTPDSWRRYVRGGPYHRAQRAAGWAIAHAPTGVFRAARWGLGALRSFRNRRLAGY